jgi:hypothetical protein
MPEMTRAEADAYWARHFHAKARRLAAENERLRTILLAFVRAYANADGLDRDGTEIQLMQAWLQACGVLGIAPPAGGARTDPGS